MKRTRSIKVNKRKLTLSAQVLLFFLSAADFLPIPFEGKSHYLKRVQHRKYNYYTYYQIIKRLVDKGWLKLYKDGRKNLYTLTKKGKLEALFVKAQMPKEGKWDGKFRMVVFDIPESAKSERNKLRWLLKNNGYKLVQKSVFVNPYPLNREALDYLKETGLDEYIRVFRIDQADNMVKLKKMFNL